MYPQALGTDPCHCHTQPKLASTVGSTIALAKSLFAHSIYERRKLSRSRMLIFQSTSLFQGFSGQE